MLVCGGEAVGHPRLLFVLIWRDYSLQDEHPAGPRHLIELRRPYLACATRSGAVNEWILHPFNLGSLLASIDQGKPIHMTSTTSKQSIETSACGAWWTFDIRLAISRPLMDDVKERGTFVSVFLKRAPLGPTFY